MADIAPRKRGLAIDLVANGDFTVPNGKGVLWIGTGGDVELEDSEGFVSVIPGVPDGTLVDWVYAKKILAANTTASGLHVSWKR